MRIALITTNLCGGGAEKALLNLAGLFSQRGHEAVPILLENIVSHRPPANLKIHALTEPGRRSSKGFLGKRLAALRLSRLVAREGPFNLVISTLPYADEVVTLARLPSQSVWYRIANTLSAELQALPRAKAARRLARYRRLYQGRQLIAVSAGVAADLRENLGLDQSRIVTLYNPFDFAAIRRLATEYEADLPTVPYVIHVGRFSRAKRHDLLFAAWKLAKPAHKLVLLTPADEELHSVIVQYGLEKQVIVAGFRNNPYPWIKHADLLVLCSDHEGMPNVLVEALACGTPVVSSDCPSGPREVLTGDLRRFLVPMNDPEALAIAIKTVLAKPLRIDDADLSRFSAEVVAAGYEALASDGWSQ